MANRWWVICVVLLVLSLQACSNAASAPSSLDVERTAQADGHTHPPGTGPHTHGEEQGESATEVRAKPVLASSELTVGPNRFVFGLVSPRTGAPIMDVPEVGVQFFKVHENHTATKVGDARAVYHSENLPVGVFVTRTKFDQPGDWGAVLTVRPRNGKPYEVQMDFQVLADSPVPRVGESAPPSRNLTKKDVKSLSEIDSGRPPNDMHDLTIAEAVRSGKPTLILFATPGYCETATCGPDLQVAQALKAKYGDRANFIHIETPSNPAAPQAQKPTVEEWHLRTEPWIFLVDREGNIAERFEGGLTLDEVEPAFQRLLR